MFKKPCFFRMDVGVCEVIQYLFCELLKISLLAWDECVNQLRRA